MCQVILRQADVESKRASRLRHKLKNNREQAEQLIQEGEKIHYDDMLAGLKETATKQHKKSNINDLF